MHEQQSIMEGDLALYAQQGDRRAHPHEVSVYVGWQDSHPFQLLSDDSDGYKLQYTHENKGDTVELGTVISLTGDLESLRIGLNPCRGLLLPDRHAGD